jgi:hypothetical protein
MPKRRVPGLFCLESPWGNDLTDGSTVGPILALLEQQEVIRFIHRDAVTREELEHYLDEWVRPKYKGYPVAYLAFHGHRNAIELGKTEYTLDDIAERYAGKLGGRILYFGSCGTLRITDAMARTFLRTTRASAICGYTKRVWWVESASFDLNLIEALSLFARPGAAFNYLTREHSQMCQRLGFKYWTLSGTR